jgi:molybdate transport system substrate-binding protein
MIKHLVRFALAAAVVMAAGASSPRAQQPSLTVFAAASMKNALDEINVGFIRKTSIKTVTSYAATSALMRQIEQGAPADIFISADLEWMDYGIKNKLINPATRVNLLGNRLVLIAPKNSKITTVKLDKGFDLAKLVGDGRIATGEVKSVPVGRYAVAALDKLGIWASVEKRMAMVENVRVALTLVARGEAERQDRRAIPRGLASGNHLSDRSDHHSECQCAALHRLPANGDIEVRLREAGLQLSGKAELMTRLSV